MDEEEKKRRKAGREVIKAMDKIRQSLIDQGVDLDKLREEMLEELEIVRAEKAAEKATKH
ncbi:MAG: hypothetical protein KDI61_01135 [Alphaproteobacteria bacterium]|nr:hypothetical protein [Alphaproteobacteria bacterium]